MGSAALRVGASTFSSVETVGKGERFAVERYVDVFCHILSGGF